MTVVDKISSNIQIFFNQALRVIKDNNRGDSKIEKKGEQGRKKKDIVKK